jgi:hypothetical protein
VSGECGWIRILGTSQEKYVQSKHRNQEVREAPATWKSGSEEEIGSCELRRYVQQLSRHVHRDVHVLMQQVASKPEHQRPRPHLYESEK